MLWEIVLAVILVIGICTALNEARLKRAARKNRAGAVQIGKYTARKTLDKKDNQIKSSN
jgi:hypothetical protein